MDGTVAPLAPIETRKRSTRLVGWPTATALAIADMVGIGVFTSLGFQVGDLPSGFVILTLWVVGGLAALAGALAYAELAAALPRSGGEYVFLSRAYHPMLGFMAGWVSATVGFAAPVALAAMAFGHYFAGVVPDASPLLMGLLAVYGVTAFLLSGIRLGSTFQNVSTALKLVLILAFIGFGFSVETPQPISFLPKEGDADLIFSAPFAVSLVYVMYSYSGWNAATYIAGEVDAPGRTLPRAILAATLVVAGLYVLLNAVFLYTTPIEALKGQLNVAQVAGEHIFGVTGGKLVAAIICFGLISTISAMMWIGPRVTKAMGEDFSALSLFSRASKTGVPTVAMMVQLVVVTVLMLTESFEAVLDYIQFSLTLCSFLAVLGVIVLRIREPGLPRPFRLWGYPLTPFVFLAVTGYMLYFVAAGRPTHALWSLLTMAVGLGLYAVSNRLSSSSRAR